MSIQFSSVLSTHSRGQPGLFSVKSVDLKKAGIEKTSPIIVIDDFRVKGRPFPPHPHAGFSANTYVFRDSAGGLRSRDSLGGDIVVGPGGIVWSQSGGGMLHEEMPDNPERELHGLQFFVNLSSKYKLTAAEVLHLDGHQVPVWKNEAGDHVYAVIGSYGDTPSPLVTAEPFTLLDVELRSSIKFDLPNGHHATVYVVGGDVLVGANGQEKILSNQQAVVLSGNGPVTFNTLRRAHFVILSGAEIREPVVSVGPFIMNSQAQIDDANRRYRSGQMGHLDPA